MNSEIGSFIVNIKTRIEGYQEQIAKIKQALLQVGKDTDIGKEIAKSLKIAESQVERLSKSMERRISSQSQLTSLTDSLQNVNNLILEIGEAFGKVTWNDLNVDGLRDQISQIQSEINNLTSSMGTNLSEGIQKAVASSYELRTVFNDLKIDPGKMGVDEISQRLEQGLVKAQDQVKRTQEEYDLATQKAEEAAQKFALVGADLTNIKTAKNNINDLFNSIEQVNTLNFSDSKLIEFLSIIEDRFQSLYGENFGTSKIESVEKIKEIFNELLTLDSPDKLLEKLNDLNVKFKELTGKSLGTNVEGFGTKVETIFKNLTQIDVSNSVASLNAFKASLTELFKTNNWLDMGEEKASEYINNLLNIDSTKVAINKAKAEVKTLVDDYYKTISNNTSVAQRENNAANAAKNKAENNLG